MAGDVGIKPTRKRFGGSSALQCYRLENIDDFWYPRQDSNLQWAAPPVSKTGASTNFATRVFGATEGTRTLDILIDNQALFQLSYDRPSYNPMVGPARIELALPD